MRTALFCILLVTIAQQCVVGYPGKSKRGLSSRIVNGDVAVPNSIQWQVLVKTRYESGPHRCGGTIISEYHILTAAHCVIDDNNKEAALPENVKVRVGEHHLSRDDDTETVMDVKCIAVHPSYNGKWKVNPWDFAILTLNEKIKFNEFVKPAKLPSPDDTDFENAELTISGWGKTYSKDHLEELRMAKTRLTPEKQVPDFWQEFEANSNETLLFVGSMSPDSEGACQGDSGGPMTWDDNGIKKVIGVFSFLTLTDCTGLSAYGKVTSALDWIKEQGVEQGIQKCPSKKNS